MAAICTGSTSAQPAEEAERITKARAQYNKFLTSGGEEAVYVTRCMERAFAKKAILAANIPALIDDIAKGGSCAGRAHALMIANDKELRGAAQSRSQVLNQVNAMFFQILEHLIGPKVSYLADTNFRTTKIQPSISENQAYAKLNVELIEEMANVRFIKTVVLNTKNQAFSKDFSAIIRDRDTHIVRMSVTQEYTSHSILILLKPHCIVYSNFSDFVTGEGSRSHHFKNHDDLLAYVLTNIEGENRNANGDHPDFTNPYPVIVLRVFMRPHLAPRLRPVFPNIPDEIVSLQKRLTALKLE